MALILKESKNRAEALYHAEKNKDWYISYSYVSNKIRKKTSRLIDNFQLGLMDQDIDRKDLTDLLKINDRFKKLALEKPEKIIISTDLAEVNYFRYLIQKYK